MTILRNTQIQDIRRTVESYLQNNRQLRPSPLSPETMLDLLDTLDSCQADLKTARAEKAAILQVIDKAAFVGEIAEAEASFPQNGKLLDSTYQEAHVEAIPSVKSRFKPTDATYLQAQVPEPYVDQEYNVVVDPALAPTVDKILGSDFFTGETIPRAEYNAKYPKDLQEPKDSEK